MKIRSLTSARWRDRTVRIVLFLWPSLDGIKMFILNTSLVLSEALYIYIYIRRTVLVVIVPIEISVQSVKGRGGPSKTVGNPFWTSYLKTGHTSTLSHAPAHPHKRKKAAVLANQSGMDTERKSVVIFWAPRIGNFSWTRYSIRSL